MAQTLDERLSSRVFDWRQEGCPSDDFFAITEVLEWARDHESTTLRYLRELQLRAPEGLLYLRFELGHTAIPAYLVRKLAERFGVAAGQLLGLHAQGDGEEGGAGP